MQDLIKSGKLKGITFWIVCFGCITPHTAFAQIDKQYNQQEVSKKMSEQNCLAAYGRTQFAKKNMAGRSLIDTNGKVFMWISQSLPSAQPCLASMQYVGTLNKEVVIKDCWPGLGCSYPTKLVKEENGSLVIYTKVEGSKEISREVIGARKAFPGYQPNGCDFSINVACF